MEPLYVYRGTIERVVDGDTLDATIDLGFRCSLKVRVRIVGPGGRRFNAPEMKEEAGRKAKSSLEDLLQFPIAEEDRDMREVTLQTFKPDSRDSFGRWLACVFPKTIAEDLATRMVKTGHGAFKD